MCGITGIVNSSSEKNVNPADLTIMLDSIDHRGPDQQGFFFNSNVGLGHKRLSIIDLSHGNQPMHNSNKSIYIIFNGEIYNFREIRKECEALGYVFRTQCDTEVIIAAYELFGYKCLDKFNGMFAFAIYDLKKNLFFLARDRLGKKPLYFYKSDSVFLFSSEIKSIIRYPGFDKKINHEAMYDYFLYQYIPDSTSIFKEINQIPPGHYMIFKDNKIKLLKYWQIENDQSNILNEDDYKEELRYLLFDSTKIRMISDVPYGVFLSGGTDSSIITALMSDISSSRIKTFSLSGGEGAFNELEYARIVSERNNTIHRDFHIQDLDLISLLEELGKKIDQPFGDSSIIPTYLISKYAKKEVTVALSGEGGDELFGGYNWYKNYLFIRKYWKKIPSKLRSSLNSFLLNVDEPRTFNNFFLKFIKRISIANKLSFGTDYADYISTSNAFSENYRQNIFNEDFIAEVNQQNLQVNNQSIQNIFFENSSDQLNKLLLTDINTYLVSDLLFKVDRMSMLNSLEVRTPLLDYRIVDLAMKIPQKFKIKNSNTKLILKLAAKDLLPKEILNRKDKRGFSIPISSLIRGQLREYIHDEISRERNYDDGYFNKENVMKIFNKHMSDDFDYGPHIWSFLMFSLWKKNYF